MARSIHLIFNPVAGQGDADSQLEQVKQCLETLGKLSIHRTTPEKGAKELTEKALHSGAELVVAAGGDGTVSGAAAALIHTDVPLGVIPLGTVNVFASSQGISGRIAHACEIIQQGHLRVIDTARCKQCILLLNVCVGFEADMLLQLSRQEKNRYGRLALVIGGLRQWRQLKRFDAHLQMPERQESMRATAITIANTASAETWLAQGPAEIRGDDQQLAITVASPDHRWGAIATAIDLFISAIQNRPVERDSVRHWKAERIIVDTTPPQNVLIDGEAAGQTPLTVECLPKSLKVIVPSSARG